MRRAFINLFRFAEFKDSKPTYSKGEGSSYNQNLIESRIDVKNYNLSINLEKWTIFFYITPLSIIKKSNTLYEIKKSGSVLGMMFVPKVGDESKWADRKAFNFKLLDIGKILYAEPGSGKSTTISMISQSKNSANFPTTSQYRKQLFISDNFQKQEITMILKELTPHANPQSVAASVDISISHEQYKLIYELIKASLLELSGWKLQMDIHKKDMLSRVFAKSNFDKDLDSIFSNK